MVTLLLACLHAVWRTRFPSLPCAHALRLCLSFVGLLSLTKKTAFYLGSSASANAVMQCELRESDNCTILHSAHGS